MHIDNKNMNFFFGLYRRCPKLVFYKKKKAKSAAYVNFVYFCKNIGKMMFPQNDNF